MDRRRLRRLLALFFIALAAPSAVLIWQAYSRLKWESFHSHQLLAEELRERVDRRLSELVAREEARSVAEYGFLLVTGAPTATYLQRSPLSSFPVSGDPPGLMGYFQVDAEGRFTTPLFPEDPAQAPLAYGIEADELARRRQLRDRLLRILTGERMTADADARLSMPRSGEAPVAGGGAERQARERLNRSVPSSSSESADAVEARAAPGAAPQVGIAAKTAAADLQAHSEARERKLAQAAFDRLSDEQEPLAESRATSKRPPVARLEEIELDAAFAQRELARQAAAQPPTPGPSPSARRKERYARATSSSAPAPAADVAPEAAADTATRPRVRFFDSEIDPFAFGLLDRDHFVLYRKVWREGERLIQGALLERNALLAALIEEPYRSSTLSAMSRLAIAFDGAILAALGDDVTPGYPPNAAALSGTLLYRSRMSAPFDQLELVFTVTSLPAGEGGRLVRWTALLMGLILGGGLYLMYRLGVRQIEVHRQQRDFVSAVSHELKTPLTSIRMYSEMLRENWADEQRKHSYYAYIHDESERLSRLIDNVLQLARMGRDELQVVPRPVTVAQLIQLVRSKISTQLERAGFVLNLQCGADVQARSLCVDDDAFAQVFINLIDNAIKFSATGTKRAIDLKCAFAGEGRIQFRVRDYGPGIPKTQLKKIFQLFYRLENELTRETLGTGIGLALVHRLVTAMDGVVDVVNREPGAEFRVTFPAVA